MKKWNETQAVCERMSQLAEGALATVVRVIGSAYRREGAKLLMAASGETIGNVSGGCLEQDVREVGLIVTQTGRAELRTYCSGTDEVAAWDLGLGCEGRVDVLVQPIPEWHAYVRDLLAGREQFAVCTDLGLGGEGGGTSLIIAGDRQWGTLGSPALDKRAVALARTLGGGQSGIHAVDGRSVFFDLFVPPPDLVIFGSQAEVAPLERVASEVGFRVVVVDRHSPPPLTDLPLDATSFCVVMTHNFAADREYVGALLHTAVRYIGILGPRSRTERLLDALRANGPIDESRIFGPVGLDIGTDGAEQVALSIIAEILAVRAGRPAESLRTRHEPIHAAR